MWKKLINFIVVFMLLTVVLTAVQINVKANTVPVADAGGPYSGDEGSPVEFDASSSNDPEEDELEYRWNFNGTWTDWSSSPIAQYTWYDDKVDIITLEVKDDEFSDTDTADIVIHNVIPVVDAGDDIIAYEGDLVCFEGNYTDAGTEDTHEVNWTFGNGEYVLDILNPSKIYEDDYNGFVALIVIDDDHDRSIDGLGWDLLYVTINNAAPNITNISGPSEPVKIGEPVPIIGNFTDPGALDTHTAIFDWGDGNITDGIVDEEDGSGNTTSMHSYSEAGVYTVTITVEDDDGGIDTEFYEYVVVFDPDAGFVTGGGWIGSPKGSYKDNLNADGKATFGFVSKYKKGQITPIGNTQFNFNAEGLHFHSSEYYWLVIAGAKAMYKGIGTISGRDGSYKFILTAWDGEISGGEDTFRIKIWDADSDDEGSVVYDTGNDTPLGGGEIMIHKK